MVPAGPHLQSDQLRDDDMMETGSRDHDVRSVMIADEQLQQRSVIMAGTPGSHLA